MNNVTQILARCEQGDPTAADELLPLVYAELRQLAAQQLRREKPGQTLQATALVHEAYVRLVKDPPVDGRSEAQWHGRAHFFAAAAEAMRRILVDQFRRKRATRHGGSMQRRELDDNAVPARSDEADLLAIHEALAKLEQHDAEAATLIKLRFFAGFDHTEAAEIMGIGRRRADRLWMLGRTWLFRKLNVDDENDETSDRG